MGTIDLKEARTLKSFESIFKDDKWDKNERDDKLGIKRDKKEYPKWDFDKWNEETVDPDMKMTHDQRAAFDESANTSRGHIPRSRVGSHRDKPVTDEKRQRTRYQIWNTK